STKDIELRIDFQVLKDWLTAQIDNIDTSLKEHEVEFSPGTQTVFQYMQSLNNPQSPQERRKASIDRFKIYVQGDATHRPLLVAMEEKFEYESKKFQGQKPFFVFDGEVKEYLKDSHSYLAGIKEMLIASERYDWGADWDQFVLQAKRYDTFTKNIILTKARKDPRLPEKVYDQILKRRAIQMSATDLIKKGKADYAKLYVDFKAQALLVAKKNKLKPTNPAAVIQFLKSKPITDMKKIEELYKTADQRLEKIMREHNLISVPNFPLVIRVAGDAESKATPVPHLQPPPLINNRGERPEFVVPSSTQGLPFDDFSSLDSAMILTAHEGRPGHDMQFSQMLDKGISFIRGTYAANNVNIEGWAVYAEDLVYPYLNDEEKLFAQQIRLWRIARMFLDPQLQLGQIKDQKVFDVYIKELGVSKAMAALELRRYKFADIGQAPSYYEGYLTVKSIRDEMQTRMKEKFNLKCFNDTLLSYGLLPLKISAERMKTDFNCVGIAAAQ
ncbi:MAG: DUF885 family protein, partial [Bdellovibrio sp.]|nr:DUF885 family protein [Bdellovibrio sp.]